MIKAGGRTIRCAIHKLIISIWNKEELPEEWKESIVVPIHKKGDKTDCNNYRGISLLPTTYKILSNILLSRLIPYTEEVIGDHQCGFRRNRSTTDQREWDQTTKGTITKEYFPVVIERLKMKINSQNFTAMVAGHGNIRSYLHQFKISETPICPCGTTDQTIDHLLFECELLNK